MDKSIVMIRTAVKTNVHALLICFMALADGFVALLWLGVPAAVTVKTTEQVGL